jgi:alternative ribosome-rescue factor
MIHNDEERQMSKKRKLKQCKLKESVDFQRLEPNSTDTEFGRGTIRDNALKAVVTSKLFTTRVVKAKKGKGSFQRKDKYKGQEPYSIAA